LFVLTPMDLVAIKDCSDRGQRNLEWNRALDLAELYVTGGLCPGLKAMIEAWRKEKKVFRTPFTDEELGEFPNGDMLFEEALKQAAAGTTLGIARGEISNAQVARIHEILYPHRPFGPERRREFLRECKKELAICGAMADDTQRRIAEFRAKRDARMRNA
jgi:hypothetical protein